MVWTETEAEDIKKRWQEYTEELYKKYLHDPDNHDGVTTHLEPDILECEVKWTSWAISNPRIWCCESAALNMLANLETQQWPQDWKRSVFIPIPKKGNVKECSNDCTVAPISHASKVMLKIPQVRLQQYMNRELSDVQAGFRKGRGTRDQTANIHWIIKKAREFQKNTYVYFIDYTKDFDCVDQTNCGKFFKRWEYQTTWPASWETYMQVTKQLELDMEEQTGSKQGKECVKAVYCHPAYLTYMQSTSCEMVGGWSTSWNQDCQEKCQ